MRERERVEGDWEDAMLLILKMEDGHMNQGMQCKWPLETGKSKRILH